ncbi:helix-turn-helix transcriptional regulator [Nonomuraea sediminis]|uniref:helix-turn-helix transcriptional regulator n=1 Tax=Nonomuraea sediminis TaxID=2835864 RepID=UPI001BDCD226|nr:LuxR family transcriptional regulator [Nonomuraea sediminis]
MIRVGALLGRDDERKRLQMLLRGARNGHGGSLLITGEPGIGKTALLGDAAGAAGLSLLRLDGVESEMTLPFAAIQRLTLPLGDQFSALTERQRQAIQVASGLAEGPPPDRFLVAMSVLALLAAAAATIPVVCVVDDAHLLDQESLDVMAFAARRLAVEPVALLFAARNENGFAARMGGIPELTLAGLSQESATALLRRSLSAPIDPASAAAIARATGGNPLALIDLAEDLSAQQLGGLGLGNDPIPVGRHLEEHYVRQARQCDPQVQQWVLLAAADTTGNLDLVTAAAATMDLPGEVVDRAESAGLVELRETIRFRHPLVRSAIYNAVSGAERRLAHRALAAAADRVGMVELEAWHSAKATLGTDAEVADRLEHTADLAARRGGLASRASILTRAAELTPSGDDKASRLAGAAEAALAVGAAQVAHELLGRIDPTGVDRVHRGRVIVVRCGVGLFMADPAVLLGAAAELIRAVDDFHGIDTQREQRAAILAFDACVVADRFMQGVTPQDVGRRLETAARLADGSGATILAGLGALILQPYAQAVPPARAAFEAILELPDHEMLSMASAIASLGTFLWDDAGRRAALHRAAAAAREAGALQALDSLMWIISLAELTGGTVVRAEEAMAQVRDVRLAMGYDTENVINAALMAWTGAPGHVVMAIADGARAVGFGGVTTSAIAALALRDLAEGHYREAYDRLKPLVDDPYLHVTAIQYADFTEAAVRSGHAPQAERVSGLLTELATVNGSAWCRGVARRAQALTSQGAAAEAHFLAAVEALGPTCAEIDLARTHLLYGEWLRRMRRRREASEQLQAAIRHFEHSGAHMFLPRARAELEATGVKPASSGDAETPDLTSQELVIARLAAAGRTNPEIAANLFISVNTVDYHLRKVFQKLGLSSRRQLADRLKDFDGRRTT